MPGAAGRCVVPGPHLSPTLRPSVLTGQGGGRAPDGGPRRDSQPGRGRGHSTHRLSHRERSEDGCFQNTGSVGPVFLHTDGEKAYHLLLVSNKSWHMNEKTEKLHLLIQPHGGSVQQRDGSAPDQARKASRGPYHGPDARLAMVPAAARVPAMKSWEDGLVPPTGQDPGAQRGLSCLRSREE